MFFSVIIPVIDYNVYLEKNLEYLSKQNINDFEVIIVSENNFKNKLKKNNLNLKFLFSEKILRPGQKRNLGAKNSQGKYLVFIDDDAYPKDNWLETAQKNLLSYNNDKIVLGGPGILCEDENFFGKCIDLFFTSNYFYSDSYRYKSLAKLNKQQMDDWPSVNFIISKKFFEDLKGFDEIYWPGEDSKLCEKISLRYGKIIYLSDMITYHYKRSNLRKHLKQIFRYGRHRGIFFKDGDINSFKFKYSIPSFFLLMHFSIFINIKFFFTFITMYFLTLILEVFKMDNIKNKKNIFIISRFYIYFSHLAYGAGFLFGLIPQFLKKKYKSSLYR